MNDEITAKLVNVQDAAKYLCISQRTLWTLTKSNKLPVIKIGRAVRYDLQDLEAFVLQHKTEISNKIEAGEK